MSAGNNDDNMDWGCLGCLLCAQCAKDHWAYSLFGLWIVGLIVGIVFLIVKAAQNTMKAMDLQDWGLLMMGLGLAGACSMAYHFNYANQIKKTTKRPDHLEGS